MNPDFVTPGVPIPSLDFARYRVPDFPILAEPARKQRPSPIQNLHQAVGVSHPSLVLFTVLLSAIRNRFEFVPNPLEPPSSIIKPLCYPTLALGALR